MDEIEEQPNRREQSTTPETSTPSIDGSKVSEIQASDAEIKDRLAKTAAIMDKILEQATALDPLDRKTVTYYTLATHCIEHVSTFPLLVLMGPMGTGKSQTLLIIKAFAYRAHDFSLRGRTLPTIRDRLGECQDGTAIIEESDRAWKGGEAFEAMLSDRYQRATAQASLKEKAGDDYFTHEVIYYGATVLHRRIPFGDPAMDGRSVFVYFKANHSKSYVQYSETDPLTVEGRKLVNDLTFRPPNVAPLPGIAGRIFDTQKLLLATAQMCDDKLFQDLLTKRLKLETVQLKEAQSIEPAGMVLQALIDCMSLGGILAFRYVKIRDIRGSLWNNQHLEMSPHQVAVMIRQMGFETKHSHGVTVVVPTPGALILACEDLSYEDEAIVALREKILGGKEKTKPAIEDGGSREPGQEG
jgi:hypothetical protein